MLSVAITATPLNHLPNKSRRDLDFDLAPAAIASRSEEIEAAGVADDEGLILRVGEVDEPNLGEPAKNLVVSHTENTPAGPVIRKRASGRWRIPLGTLGDGVLWYCR